MVKPGSYPVPPKAPAKKRPYKAYKSAATAKKGGPMPSTAQQLGDAVERGIARHDARAVGPAVELGAELGARAIGTGIDEGEVMFGALVAVWSLMTISERKARMREAGVRVRDALARMPHEQRQAGYSMLAHVLDMLDKLVAPDVDNAHLERDLGGI